MRLRLLGRRVMDAELHGNAVNFALRLAPFGEGDS